jgi:hypothetical protein
VILDTSKVSLADGGSKSAIDLNPGSEVMSYSASKMTKAHVTNKVVGSGMDVIGLVLSNGRKLCGTRTHTVGLFSRRGRLLFKEFSEVKIGDSVRGECAGMPVTLKVVGLLYFPRRAVRLVGFETSNGRPYLAESALCR